MVPCHSCSWRVLCVAHQLWAGILVKGALLISGATKAGTCFVFLFFFFNLFLVFCLKWDSFFLSLENIKLWPWNMHNKLPSSPWLFTAQSQFVFYPSHLLLHSSPAACLLPFHCLLVFGQSIPEKGILKTRWGRLAKPSECLPVLSEVPTDRAEGACAHSSLVILHWQCLPVTRHIPKHLC